MRTAGFGGAGFEGAVVVGSGVEGSTDVVEGSGVVGLDEGLVAGGSGVDGSEAGAEGTATVLEAGRSALRLEVESEPWFPKTTTAATAIPTIHPTSLRLRFTNAPLMANP